MKQCLSLAQALMEGRDIQVLAGPSNGLGKAALAKMQGAECRKGKMEDYFNKWISRLVPKRLAPRRINFSASSKDAMPPAALILTLLPMWAFIKATSSNVAPEAEKPVEVLM